MEDDKFEPQGSFKDVLEKDTDFKSDHVVQPSADFLISDILSAGQIAQIKAQGCGTFIGCEITCAIAEGRKALSQFDCPTAAGVIVFQGAMSPEDFNARLRRLTRGTGPLAIKVVYPASFTSDATMDLCDKNIQDELFASLNKQKKYSVLILDGIDSFLPEKAEPKQINRFLTGLRAASITVVSIESGGLGGLPLFPNQPDIILNTKALDTFDDLVIRVDFEKARSLRRDQQKTFFVKLVEHENGKFSFEEAAVDEYLKAKTLQLLLSGRKQKKIASETGKDQSTISRWINNTLLADSLVVKDGRRYLPTKAGRKLLLEHDLSDL